MPKSNKKKKKKNDEEMYNFYKKNSKCWAANEVALSAKFWH